MNNYILLFVLLIIFLIYYKLYENFENMPVKNKNCSILSLNNAINAYNFNKLGQRIRTT